MRQSSFVLALALVLAAGCAPSKTSPAGESSSVASPALSAPSLTDTTWKLIELAGQPARADESGAFPDLRLDSAQKKASGHAGCNRFFGSYSSSTDSLRMGPLASTRRACINPALNEQEKAYLSALDETRTWSIVGDTLTIGGVSGSLARFVAAAPS
jgi:heat shock protein HslJ